MLRRGCCCGVIVLLGLCVVAGVGGYFVGLPRLRDNLRQPIQEAVGTQIARQIPSGSGVRPAPGTYVITEDELQSGLLSEIDQTNIIDNASINLAPSGFQLSFTTNGRDVVYHGKVAASGGRLAVTDMTGDGWMTSILPASQVSKALEDGVNSFLTANSLRLTKAQLGNGTLTLTTAAA